MKKLTIITISLWFTLLNAIPLASQVLDVDKMISKSYVERGEPVPVIIRLKGDQKKLCQATRLAIVMDVSSSLSDWHMLVTTAVLKAIPLITPNADKIAIAIFADNFIVLQNWTDNPSLVQSAFAKLQFGGGTNLGNAINGTNSLMQQISGSPDCIAALIVTDGKAPIPSAALLNLAQINGWNYFFLGVGNQDIPDKKCLQDMANQSGGRYLDSEAPPYSNSIYGGVIAAVDEFMISAMKINAPTNIVLTEVLSPNVSVVKVNPPSVPPNQANPTAYTSAAGVEWTKLVTAGKATLPSIDRLDKDIYGASMEYSVEFEVAVNECADNSSKVYDIDGMGAIVTYDVNSQPKTIQIPNVQITIKPCDMPVRKTWNAEEHTLNLDIKNNYSYPVTEIELMEVINKPLIILKTLPTASIGGSGDSYAKFSIPNMASGSEFNGKFWIKPSTPIIRTTNKFQVNNLTDSYLSYIVPFFVAEFDPASPYYTILASAISTGVVGFSAKNVLEKAVFAVPHAQDTKVDKNEKIQPNSSTVWPMFNWSIKGDRGTFFIRQVGSHYQIFIAHKKWKNLPDLYLPAAVLNP